ncbi:MAG: glycosyltransferase family 4 protein [Steroidobacteraceae bacterium]
MTYFAVPALVLVLALVGTGWVRRYTLSRSILDVPNDRSSHRIPTPRGGGLAIVIAASLGFCALALLDVIDWQAFLALQGGLPVAMVGFMDDRYQVSVRVRLSVHVGAAAWGLYWLGGLPPLLIGETVLDPGYLGWGLGILAIVWTLNLFNFMDGIDGIAAAEAIFVALAGSLLLAPGALESASMAGLVFAAACCGFLFWNWPPAKIFLGDVGSGYLGVVIAILAIDAGRSSGVALFVWLILGAVFFVDASLTLLRRLIRGERVYEAHRSHAYQWLSRRWGGHKPVTLVVTAVNVMWLLPCAALAVLHPEWAACLVVVAMTPLLVAAAVAGSGLPEAKRTGD